MSDARQTVVIGFSVAIAGVTRQLPSRDLCRFLMRAA